MDPHALTDPSPHPTRVLAVLLLAGVSFALSQTLVIPALPQIGAELEASPSTTSWILTAFLLSASVATPIVGKLGDSYGKGRVLTVVLGAQAQRVDHAAQDLPRVRREVLQAPVWAVGGALHLLPGLAQVRQPDLRVEERVFRELGVEHMVHEAGERVAEPRADRDLHRELGGQRLQAIGHLVRGVDRVLGDALDAVGLPDRGQHALLERRAQVVEDPARLHAVGGRQVVPEAIEPLALKHVVDEHQPLELRLQPA